MELSLQHQPPGVFLGKMILAWVGCVVAAILYCVLHGVVAGNYTVGAKASLRWAITQWGAWPLILPACLWVICYLERRGTLLLGALLGALIAIAAAVAFAYLFDRSLGGHSTWTATLYHMTPIAGGTYLLFMGLALWLSYPSASTHTLAEPASRAGDGATLAVSTGRLHTRIAAEEVEWVRSARNYVELFLGNDAYIMRTSLKDLHMKLPAGRFVRVHRSYLVNSAFVKGLGRESGGGGLFIVMAGGGKVPIGRTYREAAVAALALEGENI